MDVGDATDPNLDGDFQALHEARAKRTNKTDDEDLIHQLMIREDTLVKEINSKDFKSPSSQDLASYTCDIDELRKNLFNAVQQDNVDTLSQLVTNVSELNLTLSSPELRAADNKATVLHTALESECWKCSKHLISSSDESFLAEFYIITVKDLPSKKYCLHILTEKGNYELTALFLEKLSQRRREMINQTVMMVIDGQRPRPLASMHIAALKGYLSLVQLFYDNGVDIDLVNSKDDTPALWAARGNHIEMVRLLIKLGANLNLENDKGSTPLYWAVRYGFTELVRVLLKEGKVNVHQQRKLGLVSPIILAAALGYPNIVEILLEHGADANTKIRHDQRALHVAAAEGNNSTLTMLLKKGNADINLADSNGNTALLIAAKLGNISTVKLLVINGALLDCKNKLGQDIWDFAMQIEDHNFLKALVKLYKSTTKAVTLPQNDLPEGINSSEKFVFNVGRTPLHAAAAIGHIAKLQCLFELGVNPKARDLNGNTCFHIAAIHDCSDILDTFMKSDFDMANSDGNTALHLAARSGSVKSLQTLLRKAKYEIRNHRGMTPLHEAIDSESVNQEVVGMIVEVVIKASSWSMVDAQDNHGNTALHIAARRGCTDILTHLAPLNPTLANNKGDTPFHIAASSGAQCLEKMLLVFNRPEKGVNINQKNNDGQSMLFLSAKRGDTTGVAMLVSYGADLSLQNKDGNTVLHTLVIEDANDPNKNDQIRQVYHTIVSCVTHWWCMKKDLQYPSDESDLYYRLMRTAMIYLTVELYNKNGLNVLGLATQMGAADLLGEILNTPNIYRFKEIGSEYVFDITNLTPQTMTSGRLKVSNKLSSVGILHDTSDGLKHELYLNSDAQYHPGVSCLDIVLSMSDETLAAKILDIEPLQTLVRDYWNTYQWIYVIIITIHIAYMILFSVFVIPSYDQLSSQYNDTINRNEGQCRSWTASYGLFLIWPLIILVFEIYSIIIEAFHAIQNVWHRCHSQHEQKNHYKPTASYDHFSVLALPYKALLTFFDYLAHLTALAFGAMVIAWYAIYVCLLPEQPYVEVVSLVLILGWLFSLSFTPGFQELHMFTIMFKYIIIHDMTRFLVIYTFVILGCGLAFHTLFQISFIMASDYTSPWKTLFNTLNLMKGLGGLFDNSFGDTYYSAGGNPTFVKCIYILYVILAHIILLSLLISMMMDTYSDIKSKECTTWRVGSLRLALRMERSMPYLKRLLRALNLVRERIVFNVDSVCWTIRVTSNKVSGLARASELGDQEMIPSSIHRIGNKLDNLTQAQVQLTQKMANLVSRSFQLNKKKVVV